MEGPTGLWWGAILTITLGEASRGTPLNDIASSLSVGIAISAMVTIFIGISGLGHRLARLFTPAVMVFMLLLGAQLTSIFFKGMLGLPLALPIPAPESNWPLWAGGRGDVFYPRDDYFPATAYLPLRVTGRDRGRVGLWRLCFPSSHLPPGELSWRWFPLGSHGTLMPGIIVTAVMTGLVNISNTYGAIRGTDIFIRIKGRAVLVIAEAL